MTRSGQDRIRVTRAAATARSRLVTFGVLVALANYPQTPQRAQLFQRLLDRLRQLRGAAHPLSATALSAAVGGAVREAGPMVPIVRLREMTAVFDQSIRRPRMLAPLLGGFAGLAPLLAAIGTYGLLSYSVLERRCEIGIRMAPGANHRSVLGEVLTQGLTLAGVGVAAGLAGALALSRVIASLRRADDGFRRRLHRVCRRHRLRAAGVARLARRSQRGPARRVT